MPWPIATRTDAPFVWPSVPLRERLLLLSPKSAHRLAGSGLGAGEVFVRGWDAFNRLATPDAVELIASLDRDPRPLIKALSGLPPTTLHGDLKLANVAVLDDDRVALIDWQMTALAPAAVELGWALVTNSGLLPITPDDALDRYLVAVQGAAGTPVGAVRPFEATQRFDADILEAALGPGGEGAVYRSAEATLGDWDRQRDLIWIIGLLLRGWRKGTDAAAGAMLASGIPATDDLAWWCERAVEAASRSLVRPAA
jgi:phosphotransferase family enzyme